MQVPWHCVLSWSSPPSLLHLPGLSLSTELNPWVALSSGVPICFLPPLKSIPISYMYEWLCLCFRIRLCAVDLLSEWNLIFSIENICNTIIWGEMINSSDTCVGKFLGLPPYKRSSSPYALIHLIYFLEGPVPKMNHFKLLMGPISIMGVKCLLPDQAKLRHTQDRPNCINIKPNFLSRIWAFDSLCRQISHQTTSIVGTCHVGLWTFYYLT